MDTIKVVDESAVDSPEPLLRLSDDAAAFLTSEQFSLLGTRSSGWNESFSRVSVFLTTLSARPLSLSRSSPTLPGSTTSSRSSS